MSHGEPPTGAARPGARCRRHRIHWPADASFPPVTQPPPPALGSAAPRRRLAETTASTKPSARQFLRPTITAERRQLRPPSTIASSSSPPLRRVHYRAAYTKISARGFSVKSGFHILGVKLAAKAARRRDFSVVVIVVVVGCQLKAATPWSRSSRFSSTIRPTETNC